MDFIKKIRERAKASQKTIVLPEGSDERVISAAEIIAREKIAKVVVLAEKENLEASSKLESLGVQILNPKTSPKSEEYANLLYELRKNKGMTLDKARELVEDPIWYGVLMVKNGDVTEW